VSNERLFSVNSCPAELGEISHWHQHTNPAFTISMLGHTVVG